MAHGIIAPKVKYAVVLLWLHLACSHLFGGGVAGPFQLELMLLANCTTVQADV